jgi:hypothetical protein
MSRTIHWTEDTKTLKVRTDIPGFFIEMGSHIVYRVKNASVDSIPAGRVVFFNGSDDFPTITLADSQSYLTSEGTLGVCAHDIPANSEGYVVTSGIVRNLNLEFFEDGDEVYLYSDGKYDTGEPIAPTPAVYLGTVVKSGANGILAVNIELGFELEEIHNVRILSSPQNNQVLSYNSEDAVWEPKFVTIDNISEGPTGPIGPTGPQGLDGGTGPTGPEKPLLIRESDYDYPYHYSGSAPIGTLTSDGDWIIKRIEYTGSSPITLNSTGAWDNRTSLIYT